MTESGDDVGRSRVRVCVIALLVVGFAVAFAADRHLWHEQPAGQGAKIVAAADDVQRALRLGLPTVVEFGGSTCANCREMIPILKAFARDHRDRIAVVSVDALKARAYLSNYRVQVLPTQVFFDARGREIGRNVGAISAAGMLAALGIPPMTKSP
jgi:thioredoxin 1